MRAFAKHIVQRYVNPFRIILEKDDLVKIVVLWINFRKSLIIIQREYDDTMPDLLDFGRS